MNIRFWGLNTRRAQLWAAALVPVLFGLVSVWLGADQNYDLRNYHLYNAYAFLTGRVGVDMAPPGLQSYFNPLLDLPYYYMSQHWPPRLVGFVMGYVHGLNFVLLLSIARSVLPALPTHDRHRLPIYLAVAGCLTTNFISEIGNTVGDAATSLFELGALGIILLYWDALLAGALPVLLLAGVISGMGAGLKLTNAVYSLALCFSLLALPVRWPARFRMSFFFGLGVLLGLAVTGGYWFFEMWRHFGDPLYPQFSSLFPSPLVRSIGEADTRFLPKNLLQALLWPFLISVDPLRVSELRSYQVIWALLYILCLVCGVQVLVTRFRRRDVQPMPDRQLYILVYIAVAFVIWMKIFSIYRYIIAIELLAPLAVFILLVRLLAYEKARRMAAWTLSGAVLVVLVAGGQSWGHVPWADPMLSAETPAISDAASTTVLLVGEPNGGPYAWLTLFLPRDLVFLGVHTSFPASKEYAERVHAIADARGGPIYALVSGYGDSVFDESVRATQAPAVARVNLWATRFGLTGSSTGCQLLRMLNQKLRLDGAVQETPTPVGVVHCELTLPADTPTEIAGRDRAFVAEYAASLKSYGFELDPGSCQLYAGHIGKGVYPYQWCRVSDVVKATKPAEQPQQHEIGRASCRERV